MVSSWATKNNFTRQKLWIKPRSQGPLKVGPATNLISEPGDMGSICGFHPLWFPEMLPYKSRHMWLHLCIKCTWWLLPHLELTSPSLAQGDINLQSLNIFQQIYVIIIATVMSFHLCWVSNFNDTFPPQSCHFLTRIPCPSSESAINRWTSESWKFRNAQFGEAQWMELLLTQFI